MLNFSSYQLSKLALKIVAMARKKGRSSERFYFYSYILVISRPLTYQECKALNWGVFLTWWACILVRTSSKIPTASTI